MSVTDVAGGAVVFEQIKPLEGWITVREAQDVLGLSKQAMHKMIGQGEFPLRDLRSVANGFIYLIRTTAVEAKKAERAVAKERVAQARDAARAEYAHRQLLQEVRVWLRGRGFTVPNGAELDPDDIAAYQAEKAQAEKSRASRRKSSTRPR